MQANGPGASRFDPDLKKPAPTLTIQVFLEIPRLPEGLQGCASQVPRILQGLPAVPNGSPTHGQRGPERCKFNAMTANSIGLWSLTRLFFRWGSRLRFKSRGHARVTGPRKRMDLWLANTSTRNPNGGSNGPRRIGQHENV